MYKKPLAISTDCICDLPLGIVEENNIEMIYYHVATENGLFLDREEITADNIFEHMDNGGLRAEAEDPTVEEFMAYFESMLKEYEYIIHISTSSRISKGYKRANQAMEKLGIASRKIYIFDSMQVSTGVGILALKAAELRKAGSKPVEIINELEKLRKKVSTSFMLMDALYLYFNDKVKLRTLKMVSLFRIRPVFAMRDGSFKLVRFYIGTYPNCTKMYLKRVMRRVDGMDKSKIFITHTKCSLPVLSLAKKEIKYRSEFEQVIVNKASGSLASYIGPNSFGVLFIKK